MKLPPRNTRTVALDVQLSAECWFSRHLEQTRSHLLEAKQAEKGSPLRKLLLHAARQSAEKARREYELIHD